jgi:cytochrome c oxidase subunit 4
MSDASHKIDRLDATHETSSAHGESLRTYWRVFYWLMGLLAATVIAAQFDLDRLLGGLNLLVAMAIAIAKGLLVVLFFMHVKQSSKLTWIFACSAFVWLAILIFLTFNDYLLRGQIKPTPRDVPSEYRVRSEEHGGADIRAPVSPAAE